jgi:hypothetical protein
MAVSDFFTARSIAAGVTAVDFRGGRRFFDAPCFASSLA